MDHADVLAGLKQDGGDYLHVSYRPGEVVNMPPDISRSKAKLIEFIAMGLSNQEIAETRGVSRRTVDSQIAAVFRTLGVQSRAELLASVFSST